MAKPGRPPKYVWYPRGDLVVLDPARLRFWRAEREMTRQELANASRIPVLTIQDYEQGKQATRADRFRMLCTALGVQPQDLLHENSRYIEADDDPGYEDVEDTDDA